MAVNLLDSTCVQVAFFLSLLAVILAEPNIGGECEIRDGIKGICKWIRHCPSAIEGVRRGSWPVSCGFIRFDHYVCCPHPAAPTILVVDKNSTLPPTAVAQTVPMENASRSANVSTNLQLVSEREGRRAGDGARLWCERLVEKCGEGFNGPHRFRLERDIRSTEMPDYDVIGTPMIETTPQPKDIGEPSHVPPFVVGGEEVPLFEYPHMAAIGFGKENNLTWECGGTLISEKFVLTAAHCLTSISQGPAEWVQLGTTYLKDDLRTGGGTTGGQTHRILRRIRHPEYKRSSKYNDVALLEIGPALTPSAETLMSHVIHPACLETESDIQVHEATASGWGRTGSREGPSSKLLKVKLSIINSSVCEKAYAVEMTTSKLRRGIDSSMICAGELAGGKDTCQGDSGGPLHTKMDEICLYKVIGVTSFGKICGFANSPAVYMRVSHFIPWIESIVWPET